MEKTVEKILNAITKDTRLIIIDGKSGAGKSTIAEELSNYLDAGIVHMDDFFLPISLRTDDRLLEPGGNVHYERFQIQVINAILESRNITYDIFDCKTMSVRGKQFIDSNKPIIVEGAYSLHPSFPWEKIKLPKTIVFLDIDEQEQLERIKKRNGEIVMEIFKEKWIPLENKYFDTFNIKAKSDILINVSDE